MSTNNIFLFIGLALLIAGVAKLTRRPGGGKTTLKNFGINFGGSNIQTNKITDPKNHSNTSSTIDWLGLGTAIIGLVTALISLATSILEWHKG